MRVLGYGGRSEKWHAAVRKAAEQPGMRLLTAGPESSPVVTIATAVSAEPPVDTHDSGPDGALAVVDGVLFALDTEAGDDGSGARPTARDLAAVLASDGAAALTRLDAAAMGVAWLPQSKELLVWRDRHGQVPCFAAEADGGLLFGSTIQTLTAAGWPAVLDPVGLDAYLSVGYLPAPMCMVAGIRRIAPAQVARWTPGAAPTFTRYWLPAQLLPPDQDPGEDVLAERLLASVRRQLPDDGSTVGVLLSGGVDSKLLAGVVRRGLDLPLRAFTFDYQDYAGVYNEVAPAAACAHELGAEHIVVPFPPSLVADRYRSMVGAYGEPFSYGLHSLPMTAIAETGTHVALSGAGPDGWYPDAWERRGARLARLPTAARWGVVAGVGGLRAAAAVAGAMRFQFARKVADGLARRGELIRFCAVTGLPSHCAPAIMPPALRAQLYAEPGWVDAGTAGTNARFRDAQAEFDSLAEPLKTTATHIRLFSADCILNWNHWSGRATGVRIGNPYFDGALMAAALAVSRSGDKPEVRALARRYMPADMAHSAKVAQRVPLWHWLRGPLAAMLRDELSVSRLKAQGLFDPDRVQAMIDQHVTGRANHEWRLWAVLSVTAWMELNGAQRP